MNTKDKNKATVSVILPVYNVEPWIGDCIESLKKQKLPGLEFIFVDDCGTDNSMRIVEAWADEDERVRIIRNPQNIGSGPSRNAGIEAACGQYYSFVDPDDLVCENFYELLYDEAVKCGCDIAKGTRLEFNDGDHVSLADFKETESPLNKRIRLMLKENWPLYNYFTYEHQTAIYKSSLFEDKAVRYGSSRVAQDITFLLRACYNTNNIAFIDSAVYYYRHRPGAATSAYTLKRASYQMQSFEESAAYLKGKPDYPNPFHVGYLVGLLCGTMNLYYYSSELETNEIEAREAFRQHLISLIETLTPSNQLFRQFPELEIFKDYNHCIPTAKKRGDIFFRDGLVQWTEFFKEHPKARSTSYYKRYSTAMLRALLSFYYARDKYSNALGIGLRFTKEHLHQLSRKDRCIVLIYAPYREIAAVLARKGLWIIIKKKK